MYRHVVTFISRGLLYTGDHYSRFYCNQEIYSLQLQSITDRMLRSIDCDVDGFLRDLDQSLEASRDVFRQFDDVMRILSEEEWEVIQLRVNRFSVQFNVQYTYMYIPLSLHQ